MLSKFFFFFADKIVVSTSCSLLHTAVDLLNETKLDKEIKSWLAFAAQKVDEVYALANALSGHNDEVFVSQCIFFILCGVFFLHLVSVVNMALSGRHLVLIVCYLCCQ
jgi:hypothetical protein